MLLSGSYAGELVDDVFHQSTIALGLHLSRTTLPASAQDADNPSLHLLNQEPVLLDGVRAATSNGIAVYVGRTGNIHDLDQSVAASQIREELVAPAFTLVCTGNQSRYID
ncbi:uncharacterized protein METZ01_LOCUS51709 [marine metagenome]|uniref:Uncharacterized protein n=1 Tax=marine metagenome TaxID=408172 RepID=A0A381S427_9ZZZZ